MNKANKKLKVTINFQTIEITRKNFEITNKTNEISDQYNLNC